jgi:HNH endonuclease
MFTLAPPITDLEARLVDLESEISRLRAEQAVVVNQLDHARAERSDGSRSLVEWVQAHLDVDPSTARDLVYLARRGGHHRGIWSGLASGDRTTSRTLVTMRYAEAGATEDDLTRSLDTDLGGVRRRIAHRRRTTARDERRCHADRFLAIQPSLDEAQYRLWGQLPGTMGRVVEKAIHDRADELRAIAGDLPTSRSQRQADALVAMAQDSIDGTRISGGESTTATVTVFVDATSHVPGDVGAEIAFGPEVGPATLETILCSGSVRVVGMDGDEPIVASHATRAIPPAVRHAVMFRDGSCTVDGCRSTYRLEPHHIRRHADGGRHTIENLTTLCWYHHHVAIHGGGYHIDPDSPPRRRRLTRAVPRSGTDPPS